MGHDWKGTRVVFEEEPAAVPEAAAEPADGPQDASAQQAEGKASGGIKWKKLCKGILQQVLHIAPREFSALENALAVTPS